ncbi:2-isopropylmalate synthase [Rhodococcus sp. BP-252]|uniref:2-isopropylmalate synthase n=1 Tax=unclassified Rhodococcus (in: high G+C Gram-positive bacteria) TaxID=192944 RepID=UPI001DA54C91|nr:MULTISPECIES: 2-isopropylmalate synthase [unclassified Rhodococcus (in: high G+C Gram-positive bacteria)]MBY6414158.1 2-isopropylmalate synthase [Rhodococcus sp. BP-320]MBY6418978.1 2-isopropylmalate synthase [Rhodococcus sp. BP-321]MBY6423731.1 2-isopropylmalate synthase [Rhodococcus sp. BP-324]MBY6428963.1 2-isopropylmalate synthase [Rhodococcus sp. BP-323]MBY6433968.1 2-isopropylmalate synthase [Rhodococcus sp. BP-322]
MFTSVSTPSGPVPAGAPTWNRQRGSQMPSHRYRDVYSRVEVPLSERDWPRRRITHAPLWVPVDLRDGNQALPEPMDPARKRRFFELMVAMGYKEIEVGYPSASQTDFDFVRLLASTDIAPEDVTVVVFTPARRDLIERTVESVRGIRNPVVVHMYTATAPTWRDVVLGRTAEDLKRMILAGAQDVLHFAGSMPNVRFEFSPEVFNLTEPDFVLDVCDAVTTAWDATPDRPVILNLPATVEVATPNVYADQIEYMHKNLARRDSVVLSVHPHNDRGTGIACAELAVLAGAQRVEGCIFGNGERTGNVDLATLALNRHAQGVDPMIDFSDIDEIRRTVEYCNQIEVHSRHPYVGDLVHTAFSGTHQDAIKKGFAEHRARAVAEGRDEREIEWRVPYLPIDPADIGRSYDAVIRVNSQSGKGGIAYLLETEYGIELPRRLQIDFARHVQRRTDDAGTEVSPAELWSMFSDAYLDDGDVTLQGYEVDGNSRTTVTVRVGGVDHVSTHDEVGPVEAVAAALAALNRPVDMLDLHQGSVRSGNDSDALTVVEFRTADGTGWSAGLDRSVLTATLKAVARAAGVGIGRQEPASVRPVVSSAASSA